MVNRDGDRRDLVVEMMELTLKIAAKTLFDAEETGDAAIIREQLGKSIRLFNERFTSFIRAPLGWPTPRPPPASGILLRVLSKE